MQQVTLSGEEIAEFRRDLLRWFEENRRDLPWRRSRDPYFIWVSEIMLQQTRVAAVIPYWLKFVERFPDLAALADATEADVLSHWAGLGYYYRARNLQKAAQRMRHNGGFPGTYKEIRELPGVGDYTAAAVASIAFNLPHPVVDGNVFRVLSRIFNDATNVASATARKYFYGLAEKLLDPNAPGGFNQAMMELGATICLPNNPQCLLCPVARHCAARSEGVQSGLPVKSAPQKTVRETRVLFWIERDAKILVWQRPEDARLMPGFWELPEREQLPDVLPGRKLGSFRHGITFHEYSFEVVEARPPEHLGTCKWVSIDFIRDLPISTVLKKAKREVEKSR